MIPKYIKIIKEWSGTHNTLKKGEIINTEEKEAKSYFSKYTWGELFDGKTTSFKEHYAEISEEEYNIAKGIPIIAKYEIY